MQNKATGVVSGHYADGFQHAVDVFASHLTDGEEIGGAFAVYHRGTPVIDIWGGTADLATQTPWQEDTRIVVFSVTKGFAAMALHLLADQGRLEWDAPVADYWPGFARNGKSTVTVETLAGHRGGLAYLDRGFKLADFTNPAKSAEILEALEAQAPAWVPGEDQGYHAQTFGMYVRELFERIAHESMGEFLRRELFDPLGSDARLGTDASFDDQFATLYPPTAKTRVIEMVKSAALRPHTPEAHVFRQYLDRKSTMRRAFTNPAVPRNDLTAYNRTPVRRAELAWGSATSTARGIAKAYLPCAHGGEFDGRRYLQASTIEPAYQRIGWSDHDRVLQKPLGWSHGFLKEETHIFSPNPESFGHAGMGGALGWADPKAGLTIGYAMNHMDWRVRSTRAVALCNALYKCLM
ncbi:MAG: serine hydrolase domain-containing protein [bacterium]